jgi:sortase A
VEQSCSSAGSVAKTDFETEERPQRSLGLEFVSFRQAVPMLAAAIVALGLAITLFALYVVREPMPAQVAAVSVPTGSPSSEPTSPANEPGATPAPSPGSSFTYAEYPNYPRASARIGTITLPSLRLSWPIFQGTTDAELAKGVGHFAGSVLPGQNDNSVLSGHRTTVFNKLGQLKRGQLILVKTSAGVFTYKVRGFRIVLKTDRTVIVPTNHAVLTLTTCYPFNNVGSTDHAFVVSADLVQ